MFPKRQKSYIYGPCHNSQQKILFLCLCMALLGNQSKIDCPIKSTSNTAKLPSLDYKWDSGCVAVAAKLAYDKK